MAVKPTGPEQCRIQYIGTVGCRDNNHRFMSAETVHFRENLIQGLLSLIMSPAQTGTSCAADTVEFIDKDN